MNQKIKDFNEQLLANDGVICKLLAQTIDDELTEAESKIWHGHPVWFLNGNPIVGYSKQKAGLRLMFWSGVDFDEVGLNVVGAKFKDASIFFTHVEQVNLLDLQRWLNKSKTMQWDYKNIVKRKGQLVRVINQ